MKKGIHPEYRTVVFHDTSVDEYFLIGSTLQTKQTIEWKDGKTYPYFTIEVSSLSHSFYTGKQMVIQKEGRVANFNRRFAQFSTGDK
ncbi:type B 50S ribosomal protein L31 [Vibrio aphrogenes]|uniref:type B 50S ribosomal protein L31 n=1 Tax=Vibrio aphrogenes TaxID=1891186 RepID=UPI000B362BE2|nr:type B 50S ribosomal protein L31 [Vibrio aphrogenes]